MFEKLEPGAFAPDCLCSLSVSMVELITVGRPPLKVGSTAPGPGVGQQGRETQHERGKGGDRETKF